MRQDDKQNDSYNRRRVERYRNGNLKHKIGIYDIFISNSGSVVFHYILSIKYKYEVLV